MSKKLKLYQRGNGLLISIGLIQIMDVIIHAGTNQLEVIRVSSNLMILAWIVIIIVDRVKLKSNINITIVGVYIILNSLFLLLNGPVNQESGSLRIPLFILLGATILLSLIWTLKYKNKD